MRAKAELLAVGDKDFTVATAVLAGELLDVSTRGISGTS